MNSRPFLVLLALSIGAGCRISKLGTDQPSENSKQGDDQAATASKPIVQPQQQAGSTYAQTVNVTVDDNGNIKEKLSLRLDYFAASKPGGVTVPSCYDAFAKHMVIGRLICAVNLQNGADVQAGQLDQICHTDTNNTPTVTAGPALTLPGCKGNATMNVYKFDPQIKVDLTTTSP